MIRLFGESAIKKIQNKRILMQKNRCIRLPIRLFFSILCRRHHTYFEVHSQNLNTFFTYLLKDHIQRPKQPLHLVESWPFLSVLADVEILHQNLIHLMEWKLHWLTDQPTLHVCDWRWLYPRLDHWFWHCSLKKVSNYKYNIKKWCLRRKIM